MLVFGETSADIEKCFYFSVGSTFMLIVGRVGHGGLMVLLSAIINTTESWLMS